MQKIAGIRFDHKIIGGYDFRALGIDHKGRKANLTPREAHHIGLALGSQLQPGTPVFIGRDGRITSAAIQEAVVRGYRETGNHVDINWDTIPTGAASWAVVQQQYGASAVISGSHNPFHDIGIKVTQDGYALFGQALKDLIPVLEGGQYRLAETLGSQRLVDVRQAYFQMLGERFPQLTTQRNVIFDAGNGIGGCFYPTLGEKVANVEGLNLTSDGMFPAYGCADPSKPSCTDPVSELVIKRNSQIIARRLNISIDAAIEMLKNSVHTLSQDLKEQLFIGFMLDGDADRCGFVDEAGNVFWPEKMAAIFYLQYLKDLEAGLLPEGLGNYMALDVRASTSTTKMVAGNNGSGWFIQAGYPAHIEWAEATVDQIGKNTKTGTSAEASGHFFEATAYYGINGQTFPHADSRLIDDGIYSALKFLTILDNQPKFTTLFELMRLIPSNPASREIRVDVDPDRKYEIADTIVTLMEQTFQDQLLPAGPGVMTHGGLKIQAPNEGLILVDGARAQMVDDSIVLARASNTSPKLTAIAEARDRETLIERLLQLQSIVATFGAAADSAGINEEIEYQRSLLAD